MADIKDSSSDSLDDDGIDFSEISELFSDHYGDNHTVDSRRRLEDKLEQRFLEKDMREFDFDI